MDIFYCHIRVMLHLYFFISKNLAETFQMGVAYSRAVILDGNGYTAIVFPADGQPDVSGYLNIVKPMYHTILYQRLQREFQVFTV